MPDAERPNHLVSGFHSRGVLPHLKREGGTYFVTFRQAGTLPKEVLLRFKQELTWIMFLKFLDDLELQREGEWKLVTPRKATPHPGPLPGRGGEGNRSAIFKPAIEPPYRWRDWAAQSDGITGDELLAFINNEESALPNGKKGAGLFRYLRTLTSLNSPGVADAREVIATVFRGVQNRMVSGYLLRDALPDESAAARPRRPAD